jgi:GAF domain-containing protein
MKAEVFIREKDEYKEVEITGADKPEITVDFLKKWTKILNSIVKILEVRSALMMRIREDVMEVLLTSENKESPYSIGDSETLGHGLYCETVAGTNNELLIENALENEAWNDNPDVELKMISYYGLPIRWPDGETLGTICVLDDKTIKFEEKYRELIQIYQQVVENDLELLIHRSN